MELVLAKWHKQATRYDLYYCLISLSLSHQTQQMFLLGSNSESNETSSKCCPPVAAPTSCWLPKPSVSVAQEAQSPWCTISSSSSRYQARWPIHGPADPRMTMRSWTQTSPPEARPDTCLHTLCSKNRFYSRDWNEEGLLWCHSSRSW